MMTGHDKPGPTGDWQSRPIAMGRNGAVSTPHLLASQTAIDVLKSGGNAIDAAVAAAAVCAVVQPFTSGIGGLGWATVYDAQRRDVQVLEFHGCVPEGTHAGLFPADAVGVVDWIELERRGHGLLGSLVPGVLAGWDELLRTKGTRSLAEMLAPAIVFADQGIPASTLLASTITVSMSRLARWSSSAALLMPGRAPLRPGAPFVQPHLAATLQRIASDGIGAFYDGPIGRRLVQFYQDNGGTLSERDLADYRPRWHAPLCGRFRGYTIKAAPAPLGDLSFLQGLAVLDRFPAFSSAIDPDYVHVSLESAKLVRTDRDRWLGDGTDPDAIAARLLDPVYIDTQAAAIGPMAATAPVSQPGPPHTITLAVVDADGNAVHLMQTIGTSFGTAALADDTGIFINGSMYFAHADARMPNGVAPGRRLEQNPAIMMAFDADDRLALICGSPGGKTRVETVRQMLVNVVDFGMNIQQAVDAPRFLASPDGRTAELESGLDDAAPGLAADLRRRGHRVDITTRRFGTGQAVMIDPATGTRMAGADWRDESVALAY